MSPDRGEKDEKGGKREFYFLLFRVDSYLLFCLFFGILLLSGGRILSIFAFSCFELAGV